MSIAERVAFVTNRQMEYFSVKELNLQIGHDPQMWPVALLKDLIDNSLDACEAAGIKPSIRVAFNDAGILIHDNGPGLREGIILAAANFDVRVSTNNKYIAPTRGQLGNFLKCLLAAPFVANPRRPAVVCIDGIGDVPDEQGLPVRKRFHIAIRADEVAQKPSITITEEPSGVKTGTLIEVKWPQVACLLRGKPGADFYNAPTLATAFLLLNPHLTLDSNGCCVQSSQDDWRKWSGADLTSPHWYTTAAQLSQLIGGYLNRERTDSTVKKMSVRKFVSLFHGLSGSNKAPEVLLAAGLPGAMLSDLAGDDGIKSEIVEGLLDAMKAHAKEVKPERLGVIGKEHFTQAIPALCNAKGAVKYACRKGKTDDGLPFVVEAAFALGEAGKAYEVFGINWSPCLKRPFEGWSDLLEEIQLEDEDDAIIVCHIAMPSVPSTDRGKAHVTIAPKVEDEIRAAVFSVTREFSAEKKKTARRERLGAQARERLIKLKSTTVSVKSAAFQVMEAAYMHASSNNTLPAKARQIMYAARTLILPLTGGKFCKKSSTFTQQYLPAYFKKYPEKTEAWKVAFDARGHLTEPHTGVRVELGTLPVRKYIERWAEEIIADHDELMLPHEKFTRGPLHRYQAVLYTEKEGFDELMQHAGIALRYDIGLMSTKGMSVTAAREMIDKLCQMGVIIIIVRDFDKSGFSLVHTAKTSSGRYEFDKVPEVRDAGLNLVQARRMGLQSEVVEYKPKPGGKPLKDPRLNLRECGATNEECDFLVQRQKGNGWIGERIELNAMVSQQYVDFLVGILEENEIKKVVPDDEALELAYRHTYLVTLANEEIEKLVRKLNKDKDSIEIPEDLRDTIAEEIKGARTPWDAALRDVVKRNVAEQKKRRRKA